ncbi:DUF4239 domain-containing protein [Allorhizocola rhizosphaerae]|uniref:bestrophin-like domain n=1 Tax=Allorhizocola rhizosphaerae TaxID=1872709 RepID=UPI000E3B706C|nr:DUF4239 domain-containing protein [Allorhizocola rhizosphaerae]
MNIAVIASIVVVAAAALSVIGFVVISRKVPERWLVADADAAGALYATIGMVYAILIALAAIAVWEPRTDAGQSADREADSLIEASWTADGLAPADRTEIQALIGAYLRDVVDREWASLRDRRAAAPETEARFTRLRERVSAVNPADEPQRAAHQQLSAQIADAASARRARIAAAAEGMPGPLWPILIIGGLISVMFFYLFGLERTFPNGLMMAVAGGMIALLLFVLYQLEYPYSRSLAVGPDSFETAISQLKTGR